jgi:hypothetical protein
MEKRYKNFYMVMVGTCLVVLVFLAYSLHIATLLHNAHTTPLCNTTLTNATKDSESGYWYAFSPSHWGNVSNYLNATCMEYIAAVRNATWKGLLPTGTDTTTR